MKFGVLDIYYFAIPSEPLYFLFHAVGGAQEIIITGLLGPLALQTLINVKDF